MKEFVGTIQKGKRWHIRSYAKGNIRLILRRMLRNLSKNLISANDFAKDLAQPLEFLTSITNTSSILDLTKYFSYE